MFLQLVFDILTLLAIFVVPAYGTIREALDGRKRVGDWLQYWAIVAICMWVSRLPLGIVSVVSWMIPFADTFKVLFFVWLWHEKFEGAKILFDHALPHYRAAQGGVQRFTDAVEGALSLCERFMVKN
eukprot:TRINITY_DN8429_c0_g1_i2.p2 TRINITY_DN8429_c0_g1~~TRINITY_DN8429_c0_g1_i2.p2  ORF type:complete len:127 (+),score=36.13 TRINITY_DN8429_c0_g1_i2:115-495(+)